MRKMNDKALISRKLGSKLIGLLLSSYGSSQFTVRETCEAINELRGTFENDLLSTVYVVVGQVEADRSLLGTYATKESAEKAIERHKKDKKLEGTSFYIINSKVKV